MGSRWGVNRSVAQIHALLWLSDKPLDAEDISATLGIARSNVSASLKELLNWGLIQMTHVLGDRRDHFQAKKDIWEIVITIADGRKRREIDPTLAALRDCVDESGADKRTPKHVRAQIEDMLEFMAEVSKWYEQIRAIPSGTLLKIMRMGSRIARAVGE
jgi:DNA-binding transcriptional regulator GbsR (MarR family)